MSHKNKLQMQKSKQVSNYDQSKKILNGVTKADEAILNTLPAHLYAIIGAKAYQLGFKDRGEFDDRMQKSFDEFRSRLVWLNYLSAKSTHLLRRIFTESNLRIF